MSFRAFTAAEWCIYPDIRSARPEIAHVTFDGQEWALIKDGRRILAAAPRYSLATTFTTYARAEWVAAALLLGANPADYLGMRS